MNDLDSFLVSGLLLLNLILYGILLEPEEDMNIKKITYRALVSCILAAYFYLFVLIYMATQML